MSRDTDRAIQFISGDEFGWVDAPDERNVLHVLLPRAGARQVAEVLRPIVGQYTVPSLPGLVASVKETIVLDTKGNEVERIGKP